MTTPAEALEAAISDARRAVDACTSRRGSLTSPAPSASREEVASPFAAHESAFRDVLTVTRFDLFCILALGVVIGLGIALATFATGIALAEVWP